jgi:hypothetical protein
MGRSKSGVSNSLFAAVALLVATTTGLAGQESDVRAAVDQIFVGMRTANSQMVQDVFAAEARFAIIDSRNGPATIRGQAVDGWINAIAGSEGSWDERIYDVEVQVDGNMASVWAPYTFYRDGEISHCGINSIELLFDAGGWKVTQLSDTRHQGECPDPLG